MEWSPKIIEIVKSPKLVAWVALSSLFLLFVPTPWFPSDHLKNFRQSYGVFLILSLFASIALLLIELASWLWKRRIREKSLVNQKRQVCERLLRLDHQEQIVLREFFLQDRNTIKLPVNQPVVAGLLRDNVIEIVQNLNQHTHAGRVASVSLSEVARDFLSLEMVGLHGNQPTDEDRDRVARERPSFINEVLTRERVWEW